MVNFTLRKLLGMIPMLLIITFLIYAGIELMPGDVIDFLIPMDQLAEMTAEEILEIVPEIKKIMEESNPDKIKKLGRLVENFDEKI